MIYNMRAEEYKKLAEVNIPKRWYGYARGWTDGKDIFINDGAFYIDRRDKILLIAHEEGHIAGKGHTLLGLMCPYGLLRWLTTF